MPQKLWNAGRYVTAYELARSGLSIRKIAKAMGISVVTVREWMESKPYFKEAIDRGKSYSVNNDGMTFRDYVYKSLPADLQALWDRIEEYDGQTNGVERVEALLRDAGKNARQHLFLHAFVNSNFNAAEACRKVNIPRNTLDTWKEDLEFVELLEHIDQAKRDMGESSLLKLVQRGDTMATIFFNKTYNRERGYGEKVEHEVKGQINHAHAHVQFSLDELELPLEVRLQIQQAIRKHKEAIEASEPKGFTNVQRQ